LLFVALVPVVIWCVLLFARGGFWRVSRQLTHGELPIAARSVAVVIPARDEATHIGKTVSSLRAQEFPAPVHIFVVDDNSSDGTAQAAEVAGATVIAGKPLEPGWTGKLWALSQGIAAAEKLHPDFLLFTDADITHHRNSLSELVAIADSGPYDLTSFMVKLACRTPAERALIPAFVFFFLMLYPPGKQTTVGAAGGCVLIRPEALQKIGGISAIRSEVIDDCSLARAIKDSGGRVWMGLTSERRSERSYSSFREIGRMISRTAFNQLNHSTLLLVGTVLGLILTYILPVLLLVSGNRYLALLGATAWLMMSVAYFPMVRFYNRSPLWSLTLPFVAVFYTGATIHSAIQYWTGRGGQWKGRAQDLHR
jgi:hopene-associated glycosyltransferase HpnB